MGNTCHHQVGASDDSIGRNGIDIDVQTLVLPPRSVRFPLRDASCEGGELLLFLEGAQNVHYGGQPGSLSCECNAAPSRARGRPAVQAWAQDPSGAVMGKVAKWPAKSSNANPSWYSARSLSIPVANSQQAKLHIELWEDSTLLERSVTDLADIPVQRVVTRELERRETVGPSQPPCRLAFQILDSRTLCDRHVVYFVRHGQSVWNAAQGSMDLHEMARTVDHPLSGKGRKQAEGLAKRIAKAAKQSNASLQQLFRPDVVYVSPLARAIQTAVIALGPTMSKQAGGPGEMVLMASAREKQNFGGLDTKSTRVGVDVLQNSLDELRTLYDGEEGKVEETFGGLRFDTSDVEDQWWFEGMAESSGELKARLQEFMSQLLYSPHRSAVVVGHSHFFRAVFKAFLGDDFFAENKELASALVRKKLQNCGVARVELDPRRGTGGGPIVSAQLVLDTVLEGEASLLACCTAEQRSSVSPAPSRDEELFAPEAGEAYQAVSDPGSKPLRPPL